MGDDKTPDRLRCPLKVGDLILIGPAGSEGKEGSPVKVLRIYQNLRPFFAVSVLKADDEVKLAAQMEQIASALGAIGVIVECEMAAADGHGADARMGILWWGDQYTDASGAVIGISTGEFARRAHKIVNARHKRRRAMEKN